MHIPGSLRGVLAVMVLLAGCAPFNGLTSAPQPLPSPSGPWTIVLHQTGGFAGVSLSVQVSSDGRLQAKDERSGRSASQELPAETMTRLRQLYSQIVIATPGGPPSACADCFIYDLQMVSGGNTLKIGADDTTLAASGAADLVKFLQQLRDQALRQAP